MERYTPTHDTVSKVFHSVKAPYPGLVIDLMRFTPNAYTLRLYRDNFEDFSEPQRLALTEYINEVMRRLNSIPNFQAALEVFEKVPNV